MVTVVTQHRRHVFSHFSYARLAIQAIRDSDDYRFTDTYAYVVMPDHLHWLFQLGRKEGLSRVVQRVKAQVSRGVRADARVDEPVWQPGFHDHAMRTEESLVGAARYIVANPLRAGIARSVREYPHWDCVWL
nr:transposase [Alcanivorax hongdengensis]